MAAPMGNKFGAKPRKWEGAIRRAIARNEGALNRIADKIVALAEGGEQWAVTEIGNRLDGKAKQQFEIEHSGEIGLTDQLKAARERVAEGK